jgi:hypothetical protein
MDLKVRYEIEFHKLVLNCYISISTPSGLSEWFVIMNFVVNFLRSYGMIQRKARLASKKSGEKVKFMGRC